MRTLIDSLINQIEAETPYEAHFGEVVGTPDYPYVLLWTSTGRLEQHTLGGDRDLTDRLGVTMVATASTGVLSMAPHVRRALKGFTPDSGQWVMQPLGDPYDSQNVDRDRDVSLPNHGYPAYAVDLYYLDGTTQ